MSKSDNILSLRPLKQNASKAPKRMKRRKVPFVEFPSQYESERETIHRIVDDVFSRGHFVGGAQISQLEEEIAKICDVRHAVAVASGTDAITLALNALGIGSGDEVILPPNSFVSSAGAVITTGAKPVFADVCPDLNINPSSVEEMITPKTKAIMPVHLTGRICEMDRLEEIAARHELVIIEDAAQSIGSTYRGRSSGSFGAVNALSMHPLKNLNAAGDAGFITTDQSELASRLRRMRNHGLADRNTVAFWGVNSRMDTLQAAILQSRLGSLLAIIERRRKNADLYRELLNQDIVELPHCRECEFNTFHLFVIQVDERNALMEFLTKRGIETNIHYPVPIHLQPAAAALGYKLGDLPVAERQADRILSLPIHQFLGEDDVIYVSETINRFYK